MKKTFILLTIMIMLSPALSVKGTSVSKQIVPQDFDSSIGVVAGDTLYYNIDTLVFPPEFEPENITLPDFAGNTLYCKVMWVDDEHIFGSDEGIFINYALGVIFEEDETITVDEGLFSGDYVIPAGSATPSAVVGGVPHWNFSYGSGPSLFFINNDYAEHTLLLEAIGFTVTETADSFSATIVNGSGEITGTWRKSDGICTYLLYDDIYFMSQNFTGFTFELSFDSKEYNPLPVTNGDVISFNVDIAEISVEGTGDFYDDINQTILNSIISEAESLVGEKVFSVVVSEVRGCYYKADVYGYNPETGTLEKGDIPVVFNGFFGSINTGPDPFYEGAISPDSMSPELIIDPYSYYPGIGPAITPDWRIYEGYTILGDTIVGVYIDELMTLLDPPADEITFHAIEAGLALKHKRDFYYFQEAANLQVEENYTWAYGPIMPEAVYDVGAIYTIEQNGYLCYTETGIGAALRVRGTGDIEAYDDITAGVETGTIHVEIDFKIRNPEYNPPEIINNNILPGFTWFVAIPAIVGLAAISIIVRRRK